MFIHFLKVARVCVCVCACVRVFTRDEDASIACLPNLLHGNSAIFDPKFKNVTMPSSVTLFVQELHNKT